MHILIINMSNTPIPPNLWLDRMRWVNAQIDEATDAVTASCLRHLFHLSQLAPGGFRELARPRLDETVIETLLDTGAYHAASLGLIGDACSLSVTTLSDGRSRATIEFPALLVKSSAQNFDLACAIVKAWSQLYLDVYSVFGDNAELNIRKGLKEYQFSRHRRQTEH